MNQKQKVDILSKVSLFGKFKKDEILQIAQIAFEKKFNKGEILIHQGDNSKDVFVICQGYVKVYLINTNGVLINLNLIGENEIVGEMSLIDNVSRSATVEAIKDTQVLLIRHNDFENILLKNPQMTINLLKLITGRLRQNIAKLEDINCRNLSQRTWKTLQALERFYPDKKITLSHEEISEIVGATRARVSEALQILQKEGKINLGHRSISFV